MSEEAVEAQALERWQTVVGSESKTEEKLIIASLSFKTPVLRSVLCLEEPLFCLLPPHLQETGALVMSSRGSLQRGVAISTFPLKRLAASIRSSTRVDDGEAEDLLALLTRAEARNRRLTDDQKSALARWLVRGLLDYLPQEDLGNRNDSDTRRRIVDEALGGRPR
jgi:hypothetical protein